MMSAVSPDVSGVGSELVFVYVVCVLVCGFGSLGTLRMTGRGVTHSGVFLASCLLDVIPNSLTEMRETFTELGVTLRFPVPEFIVAVGFLFLLVMEELILTLRDECEQQHGQKEGQEEKEALLLCSLTSRPHHDPSLSPVRSSILLLSLCLFSVFQGLSADAVQLRPDLLLRTSLIACSLVFLLAQSHMRRSAVSVCVTLLSSAFPLGFALRHTHMLTSLRLARSTLMGLSVGSFTYIIFMDMMPRVTASNEHRIAKVTLILTGFSVLTATLLLKT